VRSGAIKLEEVLRRYQLEEEEYRSWERAFEQRAMASDQLEQGSPAKRR
jgi:hypothetical protein